MRTLILVLIVLTLTACSPAPTNNNGKEVNSYIVRTIKGCEYIEVSVWRATDAGLYSLTHKGDCKNPIHTCNSK